MTDFRPGDIVTVELEVLDFNSRPCLHPVPTAPLAFEKLVDAGKVTLVRRAEPDWQEGEFGQHVETGEIFRYLAISGGSDPQLCWLYCGPTHGLLRWRTRDELAGKLVRCTVTPEVTS